MSWVGGWMDGQVDGRIHLIINKAVSEHFVWRHVLLGIDNAYCLIGPTKHHLSIKIRATCKALRWNFINYFKQAAQKNQSTDFIGFHIICLCSGSLKWHFSPSQYHLFSHLTNIDIFSPRVVNFSLRLYPPFGVWTWGSAHFRESETPSSLVSEEPCVDHKPGLLLPRAASKGTLQGDEEGAWPGGFFQEKAGKQTLEDSLQDLDVGQRPQERAHGPQSNTQGSSAS